MAVRDSTLQSDVGGARAPAIVRAKDAVASGLALILRTTTGRIAFAIVLIHVIVAVTGPWITPYPPTEYDLPDRFGQPSAEHWLGTDDKGRDVLSRVLAGSRSIVWIATVGTVLGVTLGTVVGVTSGYFGGRVDQIIMRFVDWFLAIPSLLLAILIINMSRQRFSGIDESWLVILTIGISFMPNNSRVIRSAALSVKPLEFVESARLRGEPTLYIMFREILPNITPRLGGGGHHTAELRAAAHRRAWLPRPRSPAALVRLGADGQREFPPHRNGAISRLRARFRHGLARGRNQSAVRRDPAGAEPAGDRRLIDDSDPTN